MPEKEYAGSISFAENIVIAPGDIANNLAAFQAAHDQGTASDFLDTLTSAAVNPAALSLKFIERVAAFSKTIDRFPAVRNWTLKALSNGTELRFRPTEYLSAINTTRDGDIRWLLWEAKYGKLQDPRAPERLFLNAARLARQIVIDGKVLEFLFAKSRRTGISRAEWERRVLTGFAVHTLLRDNKWPMDVCCDLIDGASASAARRALSAQTGTLVLVAHVGFLQICFAFVERLFGDSFYLGGRVNDPRAALFEGLRSLTRGKAVLIAPDGGIGSRRHSISVLDQPTTIGSGAALLAYETGCPTSWLNADIRGERFFLTIERGPQRRASEMLPEFAARMAQFYEHMLNSRLSGEPENLAMSRSWLKHLRRPLEHRNLAA